MKSKSRSKKHVNREQSWSPTDYQNLQSAVGEDLIKIYGPSSMPEIDNEKAKLQSISLRIAREDVNISLACLRVLRRETIFDQESFPATEDNEKHWISLSRFARGETLIARWNRLKEIVKEEEILIAHMEGHLAETNQTNNDTVLLDLRFSELYELICAVKLVRDVKQWMEEDAYRCGFYTEGEETLFDKYYDLCGKIDDIDVTYGVLSELYIRWRGSIAENRPIVQWEKSSEV